MNTNFELSNDDFKKKSKEEKEEKKKKKIFLEVNMNDFRVEAEMMIYLGCLTIFLTIGFKKGGRRRKRRKIHQFISNTYALDLESSSFNNIQKFFWSK